MKNLVFILLAMSILSCSKKEGKTALIDSVQTGNTSIIVELNQAQYDNAAIVLGKVTYRNMSNNIKVSGLVDVPPQNLISVSAPLGGFVRSTSLLQGTHINKGEVLAIIENPDFIQLQQDYLDTKNKLAFLSLEFDRQNELNKENVSAAKVFQQTTTDFKNLKNILNALEEKLKLVGINPSSLQEGKISSSVKIKAAISGCVTAVNVNIGKYVTPNDVMFEIVDTQHLHAELNVFEKDIMNVQIGQKVKIRLTNDPTKELSGHIHLINHKINPDRTVRVHAHFDDESLSLMPNMFIDAEIETKNVKATVVPNEAVINSEGKDYIFVLTSKNSKVYSFEMIEIKKLMSDNTYTSIILPTNIDIQKSDIVIKGAFDLSAKLLNAEEE